MSQIYRAKPLQLAGFRIAFQIVAYCVPTSALLIFTDSARTLNYFTVRQPVYQ